MREEPIIELDAKYLGMKFEHLIQQYPKLKKFLIKENPPKFDLGDPTTLSEINSCLFKELSNLEMSVPPNYLIPAYSLRMAYAQIINSIIKTSDPIIEIGTGASAAVAMLLARNFNKKVLATEINPTSFKSAKKNIDSNKLNDLIKLVKSEGEIIDNLIPEGNYSAVVSYPPIYPNDLTKLRKQRGWKGVESELIAGEKELDFCFKIVNEAIDNSTVKIDYVIIQIMNREQLKQLFKIYESKGNCKYATIKVGTRKRFVFIFENK